MNTHQSYLLYILFMTWSWHPLQVQNQMILAQLPVWNAPTIISTLEDDFGTIFSVGIYTSLAQISSYIFRVKSVGNLETKTLKTLFRISKLRKSWQTLTWCMHEGGLAAPITSNKAWGKNILRGGKFWTEYSKAYKNLQVQKTFCQNINVINGFEGRTITSTVWTFCRKERTNVPAKSADEKRVRLITHLVPALC